MKHKTINFMLAFFLAFNSQAPYADDLADLEILDVMVGNSSNSNDETWFRVAGLVGHVNCQYAPGNVTLFYATNDGPLSAEKALSVLLAAKMAGRKVSIIYMTNTPEADFWGYGISKCQLHRISIR